MTSECLPNMLLPNKKYAITICPNDAHQYLLNKSERLEYVYSYIKNYHMSKLDTESKYELYPEISTPKGANINGKCRIHFHGSITFTEEGLYLFYMYILNALKNVSTVEIKDDFKDGWDYCTKNKVIMLYMCKRSGIPYKMTHRSKKHNRVMDSIKDIDNMNRENQKTLRKERFKKRK